MLCGAAVSGVSTSGPVQTVPGPEAQNHGPIKDFSVLHANGMDAISRNYNYSSAEQLRVGEDRSQ